MVKTLLNTLYLQYSWYSYLEQGKKLHYIKGIVTLFCIFFMILYMYVNK